MKIITIIAAMAIFSGCITVNKIYPIAKRDTVYLDKPILGYWPHDRGIDPGFWVQPSLPSIPSGPFYPIYKPRPGCDTTSYIRINSGNTDTLKVSK